MTPRGLRHPVRHIMPSSHFQTEFTLLHRHERSASTQASAYNSPWSLKFRRFRSIDNRAVAAECGPLFSVNEYQSKSPGFFDVSARNCDIRTIRYDGKPVVLGIGAVRGNRRRLRVLTETAAFPLVLWSPLPGSHFRRLPSSHSGTINADLSCRGNTSPYSGSDSLR